jgi:hypothetical protein
MTAVVVISSLVGLGFIFSFLAYVSVKCYKRLCCRMMGIIIPSKKLFSRIFNRIFLVTFLELFISAYISLAPLDSIENEFQVSKPDGISAVAALVVILMTSMILAHMAYIIITYFKSLDDEDIK